MAKLHKCKHGNLVPFKNIDWVQKEERDGLIFVYIHLKSGAKVRLEMTRSEVSDFYKCYEDYLEV